MPPPWWVSHIAEVESLTERVAGVPMQAVEPVGEARLAAVAAPESVDVAVPR